MATTSTYTDGPDDNEYGVVRPTTPAFTSYEEVLAYFHRFLSREFEHSPADSFEKETELIQSQLLAINAAGILSFSSQPGTTITIEEEVYHQRSYLSCYMPRDLTHKLRDKLEALNMIVIVEEFDDLFEDVLALLEALQEDRDESLPSSLEDNDTIVVTKIVFEGQSDTHTTIIPGYKFEDLGFILENTTEEHRQVIEENLVQVHFIDPQWGRETELFDKLVEILAQ